MDLPANYEKLTRQERRLAREQYIKEQRGLCCFCKAPLDKQPARFVRERKIKWSLFPPNFTKYPIHLHHSHDTDMTIGAVHALCNAYMWQYRGE